MSSSFGKGWGFLAWGAIAFGISVQLFGHENRKASRREADRYQKPELLI